MILRIARYHTVVRQINFNNSINGITMKKICTLLVIAYTYFIPLNLYAEPSYVDLVYKDTLSALPKDSSWIKKLFSKQERKVFLVVG